MDKRWKLTFLA